MVVVPNYLLTRLINYLKSTNHADAKYFIQRFQALIQEKEDSA